MTMVYCMRICLLQYYSKRLIKELSAESYELYRDRILKYIDMILNSSSMGIAIIIVIIIIIIINNW